MEATLPIWPLTSLRKRNSHEGHLLVLPSPNPSEDNREGTTIERENGKRRTRLERRGMVYIKGKHTYFGAIVEIYNKLVRNCRRGRDMMREDMMRGGRRKEI